MKTLVLLFRRRRFLKNALLFFKNFFYPVTYLGKYTVSKTFIGVHPEIIPVNLSQNPMSGFKETVQGNC